MPFLSGCNSSDTPSSTPAASTPANNGCATCAGSMPTTTSADCPSAPSTVTLPPEIDTAMQDSYTNSFPGGSSQERGGTLVRDGSGNVTVVNEGSGTSGTFSPDRNVARGQTIVGTYHTHPYDASEGGHQGVSLSGADIAYANRHNEPIYVDSGTKQFMIMPTTATSATDAQINNTWDTEYASQLGAGASIQDASAAATMLTAQTYGMAYYEGDNGTLTKVSC